MNLMTLLQRNTKLLLGVAVLTMCACIMIAIQQFQINNLKKNNYENLQLLHDFQTSQYNFDQSVTNRLK